MSPNNRIIAVVGLAMLAITCDNPPTMSPSPVTVPPPAPAPPSAPSDVWNISVRMTAASGGGCIGETMRAQLGVPKNYTLSIKPRRSDTADVRLSSASGDFTCTFTGAVTTPDGFSTFGKPGFFSCETGFESVFQCADGTFHNLFAAGQDISGQLSGNEIAGRWAIDWAVDWEGGVEVMSEFTGRR